MKRLTLMAKEKAYGLSYQTAWQTDVQILPNFTHRIAITRCHDPKSLMYSELKDWSREPLSKCWGEMGRWMFKVPISRGLFQEQKGLIPSPRWKRAKIGTFGCPVTNGRVQNVCIVVTFHLLFPGFLWRKSPRPQNSLEKGTEWKHFRYPP